MTMILRIQTGSPVAISAGALALPRAYALPSESARILRQTLTTGFVCAAMWSLCTGVIAQNPPLTGPQQLSFAGLRAVSNQGQINAIRVGAQGSLYLLIDQKDGVRVLKTDPDAATILVQAQLGAKGDIGLAMALDPVGNVYVTGTTTSGAMSSTSGAAFPAASGTSINSFVAKFDSNLNPLFLTFAGGGATAASSIAATADAVFITGSVFAPTVPVTPSGILQSPAYGSTQNGFVEKFSANGTSLLYATYLTGANGSTTPAAIVVDSADNAYVAGTTTSPGYPTIAAVVPEALGATSGFLTRLTPAGDGIAFSTYIPGGGITSLAIDPVANNLLLSGAVALGQFPVATVSVPLVPTTYQVLLRMPLDGSSVLASTVIAPGTQSFAAAGPSGVAWVDGSLSLPLLPLTPLSMIGNSFAARVNAEGSVDQTARFGGVAASNPGYAGAPVALTSIAVDAGGNAIVAGSFAPYASQSLLSTQTFDLPLTSAPTGAFPSNVRAAVLPASACNGSLCAGSAAYLAKLTIPTTSAATASLALSTEDSPNLTLRNLSTAEATGLQISVSGFLFATDCGPTLGGGAECTIALTSPGPGYITAQATNAAAQTQTLPALVPGTAPAPIAFSPKELDFGIVSAVSGTVTRTITVTNLTQQSQTFSSSLDVGSKVTLPYAIAESNSDCTLSGSDSVKLLAPGGTCHIAVGLSASNNPGNDGPIHENWSIGARDVQITAYGQAAALSLSAPEIDFGTQYAGGLRLPRYLYLSNSSTLAIPHAPVTLPASSPFSLTDACPGTLEPATVCQLQLAYLPTHTPSYDAAILSLDEGLTALVTGRSLPQPTANGASVNPNLSVSATSISFTNPVVVTGVSSGTQALTIQNTGATAFTLSLSLTGDFTRVTNCGATLAGGASCNVVLEFAPSQPGTRQGLLAITAGAGTTPEYVTLSGTGIAILSPANNGTLNFNGITVGQPEVQWYRITQPFTSFSAATSSSTSGSPFAAILAEDIGYGHGQPSATAFSASVAGTCLNCWLGVRFTPGSIGLQTGTLTLTSSQNGNPYVLALSGSGLPMTGLVLTPVAQDFGPVPINSSSGAVLFALTNLVAGAGSINVATPAFTGDFVISGTSSGGAPCGGSLAYSATCFVNVIFTPTASGPRTGTLTLQAGGATATAALTGYGSPDLGLSLKPTALTFNNVPGSASTQQTITLTNTSSVPEQFGVLSTGTAASTFQATSNCGTLVSGTTCSMSVRFTPATAPTAGILSIPVTTTVGGVPVLATYTVPLIGAYTTEDAGLEIVASEAQFGPQAAGAAGVTRQFTIDNLTQKSVALAIALPRQFVLSGAPCSGLAPYASCNFAVSFLPLANGDITGTLFAQATPTDGSATLNGLGYVEGYGIGSAILTVKGNLQPGNLISFGQVPSGQSAKQALTLTNASPTTPLTIRRITSEWPFLSTTTCGATLAPAAVCTVSLTYTPINQLAPGANAPPASTDTGTLAIESDAVSSPDLIAVTGNSTPVTVPAPSNSAPLATFTASQSSLTFTNTVVGAASLPQTLSLDNTGTVAIDILGIQSSPDFTVASNCSTILPGASCLLTVTFTPQSSSQSGSATRIGAIEISSNASTSLEFISLIGASSPSTLTILPAAFDFGAVLLGANSPRSLQLTNAGSSAATFTGISASGDYTVANGSCPPTGGALVAGASCSLSVTFAPSQTGIRAGALSVATSATPLPITVPLTGTGIQSHLQILPASLNFGSVPVGVSSNLSLTLANAGTAPITGIVLAVTGDYSVSSSCAVTMLAASGSCSVTVTFTPSAAGVRTGTLTVTSSDPTSPATVTLTGSGILSGSFILTANGAGSASATVLSGTTATYALMATPTNGFTGTVVLNCTPLVPVQYAYCSLQPSSITLSGTAQNAAATLTTVTSIASAASVKPGRTFGDTFLALLFPALIFTWKARTSRHPAWRRIGPIAWAIFAAIALLTAGGCGSNSVSPSNLRYAAAGVYQYQVTATGLSNGASITQEVTLNLTVQ